MVQNPMIAEDLLPSATGPATISGSLSILFLYDVCDEIRLEELRRILKLPPAGREPPFRQPAPEYVQFARPPVAEPARTALLVGGEQISGRLAYYEYGVVSLNLVIPFEAQWDEIVMLAARWMNAPELELSASELVQQHLQMAAPALVNLYEEKLNEDYYIIHLRDVRDDNHNPVTAATLMERYGNYIGQIVRGEPARFSPAEQAEILEYRMSYYDTDLLVVGWSAAVVYDTPEGAAPTIQLLEYANTQLLEFRHYDAVLTRLLSAVYRTLERGSGFLSRWRLAHEAERLNTMRLEVRELSERVDNSIKFLSDMFAARLYRMAATKIGVPDYRTLVEQKLQSAADLYAFMMNGFYQARGFLLELMIVIILLIDLAFLFRGK
jgi:hypothetical protein